MDDLVFSVGMLKVANSPKRTTLAVANAVVHWLELVKSVMAANGVAEQSKNTIIFGVNLLMLFAGQLS